MSTIADELNACTTAFNPQELDPISADDIVQIMAMMGQNACASETKSWCSTTTAGVITWAGAGAVNNEICSASEKNVGCETLAANFSRTLVARNSLSCVINKRVQENVNNVVGVNELKIVIKDSTCCACLSVPGLCSECNTNISQSNNVKITGSAEFSVEDSIAVQEHMSRSIAEDLTAIAERHNVGVGDGTAKTINVSDIQDISNSIDTTVTESINRILNNVNVSNRTEIVLEGVMSYGSCVGNITQENVVDVISRSVMTNVFEKFKEITDQIDIKKDLAAETENIDEGTVITPGGGSTMSTVIYLIIFMSIIGVLSYLIKSGKVQGGKLQSIKALLVIIILLFIIYVVYKIYKAFKNPVSGIKNLFKSTKEGFYAECVSGAEGVCACS